MKMEDLIKEAWETIRTQAKKYKLDLDADDVEERDNLVDILEEDEKNTTGAKKKFKKDPIVVGCYQYLMGAADAYDVTLSGLLDGAL